MTRRAIMGGSGVILLLLFGSFAAIIPLRARSGVVDTTVHQCPSLQATTKRYHLLLGQLHDYHLVAPHVITPPPATACGQPIRLRLYL